MNNCRPRCFIFLKSLFVLFLILFTGRIKAQAPPPGGPNLSGSQKVFTVTGSFQLTITATNTVCNYNTGSILVSATGGTAPYWFSDDGVSFQSNGYFISTPPGQYSVVVKDAAGLVVKTPVTIGYDYESIFPYIQAYTNPTSCSASDASFTYTGYSISGGLTVPPFKYSMDGINFQSSNTFSNLSAGNYTLFVQDANGCIGSGYYPIDPNCDMQFTSDYSPGACTNDGYISIKTVTGGSAPYQYSVNGGSFQNTGNFNSLAPGLYKMTIRDATGKTLSYSFPIFKSCNIQSTAAGTDASCGNNDGTVTVTASAGTAPYRYSLDGTNFQSNNVFTGLTPGEYNFTIRDAAGLVATANAIIHNNCPTRVTATATNTTCGGMNGKITAGVINGTPPYQYSIDGVTFQPSNVFSFLWAGTYTVTAKDAAGQTITTSVTIRALPEAVYSTTTLPTSCSYNDGIIAIKVFSGTPPYQYSLTPFDFQDNNVFKNLYVQSLYQVYVKDGNGCVTTWLVNGVGLNCINVTAVTTDARCGQDNGSITATGAGGVPPYEYSLDGINFQSSGSFINLPDGSYTVTVKGSNGAINSTSVTVNKSCIRITATPIPSTCGNNNGSLTVMADNGTAPYQYSLDGVNFKPGNSFTSLLAGNYTVTVKDAAGNTNQLDVSLADIAGPQLTTIPTAASCNNRDGSITANVINGTAPFTYSIAQNDYKQSNIFTGLSSGTYPVTVMDINGCIAAVPTIVPLTNTLTVDAGADPVICEGTSVRLNVTSNAGSFSWSPATGLSNASLQNPVASPSVTTQYYLTATEGPCTANASVVVEVLPAPVPVAASDTTICFGNSVQLFGSGGVSYSWSPATYLDNSNIFNPTVTRPGNSVTYSLSVTGSNGCTSVQSAPVTVTVASIAKVSAGDDTTVAIGQPLQLHATDVNSTGFDQYQWSPSFGLNDPSIENPVAVLDQDMRYTVVASTPGGCEATAEIRVKVYAGPEIYVPNAFTPNGDGHNDLLRAISAGIKVFRYFTIYNRYGQRVFTTNDPAVGWNGTLNGRPQNSATFVWEAEGIDYKGAVIRRKGTVILIR